MILVSFRDMSDMMFDIQVSKAWFFLFESFFQESESEIDGISSKNLSSIGDNNSGFRRTKIDAAIEIEILILVFCKLRQGDDGRNERDYILGKSTPDILNHINVRKWYENINNSEFDILSCEPDRISELFPVYHYGNNRSGNKLHLGFDYPSTFAYFPLHSVKGSMFYFFHDMIDLVHSYGAFWILSDVVHMDDIRECENGFKRDNNIARNLVETFSCLTDSFLDGFRNSIQIGNFPVDDIFLTLSHNGRTKDFELSSFYGTNKNLDFRGSYIECYELIIIDNVAYLEGHRL